MRVHDDSLLCSLAVGAMEGILQTSDEDYHFDENGETIPMHICRDHRVDNVQPWITAYRLKRLVTTTAKFTTQDCRRVSLLYRLGLGVPRDTGISCLWNTFAFRMMPAIEGSHVNYDKLRSLFVQHANAAISEQSGERIYVREFHDYVKAHNILASGSNLESSKSVCVFVVYQKQSGQQGASCYKLYDAYRLTGAGKMPIPFFAHASRLDCIPTEMCNESLRRCPSRLGLLITLSASVNLVEALRKRELDDIKDLVDLPKTEEQRNAESWWIRYAHRYPAARDVLASPAKTKADRQRHEKAKRYIELHGKYSEILRTYRKLCARHRVKQDIYRRKTEATLHDMFAFVNGDWCVTTSSLIRVQNTFSMIGFRVEQQSELLYCKTSGVRAWSMRDG